MKSDCSYTVTYIDSYIPRIAHAERESTVHILSALDTQEAGS